MSGAATHSPIDIFIEPMSGDASQRDFNLVRWIISSKAKPEQEERRSTGVAPARMQEYLSDIW